MNILIGPVGLILSLLAIASTVTAMLLRTFRLDVATAADDSLSDTVLTDNAVPAHPADSSVRGRAIRIIASAYIPLTILTVVIVVVRVNVIA